MCGLALAASLAIADLYGAGGAHAALTANPLLKEPLYVSIVTRAEALEAQARAWRTPALKAAASPVALTGFPALKAEALELSRLDMQGHVDLAARKSDGDLKCILKGISQDLPKKVALVEAARTGAEQDAALDELAYLLDDNAGVLRAPIKPPV